METATQEAAQAAAAAAGENVETPVYEDYFGFAESHKWYFPDGKQFIEFQRMNEGQKAQFQRRTNRDLVVERASGNARMKMDVASERHELIKAAVVGWFVYREGSPAPYSNAVLEQWLAVADPKLVEDLEKEIRKNNPWLLQDMSVEDIDKEIENLKEMRDLALERDREKAGSSSR